MLAFWFRYVNRAISLIQSDNGRVYYESSVKAHLHEYMGKVFEKMAKEFLMLHSGKNGFPILTEISDYQDVVLDTEKNKKSIEIDLLGKDGKSVLLLGECKFKNEKFDKADYESFIDKVKYIPASNPLLCIFSLNGFSDSVKKMAGNCRLIGIDEMY